MKKSWDLITDLSEQGAALLLGYRPPSCQAKFQSRLNEQHMLNDILLSGGDFTVYM